MEELQTFEYTPDHQPDAEKPITVTLDPLGPDEKWAIEASMGQNEGTASFKVISRVAQRAVVGMKGGDVGDLSGDALRRKLRELLSDPPLMWRMFFAQVIGHAWGRSILKESLAKKS